MIGELPPYWTAARLGHCLQRRTETVLPSSLGSDYIQLVGLEDIEDGGRGGIQVRSVRSAEVASLKTRFYKGDILYGLKFQLSARRRVA